MKKPLLVVCSFVLCTGASLVGAETVSLYCGPGKNTNLCPSHLVIDDSAQTITANWCGGGDGTLHGKVTITGSEISVEESEAPFDNYEIDRATGHMSMTTADSDDAPSVRHASGEAICQTTPPGDSPQMVTLKAKAEAGDLQSQLKVAKIYHDGDGVPQDAGEAAKWFRMAAEQGSAHAQYQLGLAYATGVGVDKSNAEAAKWYRKAAEQGDAQAQDDLGSLYLDDDYGLNYPEALKWLRQAADQGNSDAQKWLGLLYKMGDGVSKDESEAYFWYSLAVKAGNHDAEDEIADVEANITPEEKAAADQRVLAWKPTSAPK
jgi:hypothetical protein